MRFHNIACEKPKLLCGRPQTLIARFNAFHAKCFSPFLKYWGAFGTFFCPNQDWTLGLQFLHTTPKKGQWWPKAQEELQYPVSTTVKLHVNFYTIQSEVMPLLQIISTILPIDSKKLFWDANAWLVDHLHLYVAFEPSILSCTDLGGP